MSLVLHSKTNPTFETLTRDARCAAAAAWRCGLHTKDRRYCGCVEEGEGRQARREMERKGGDRGGGGGDEDERWSAESGSVSASVSATTGSSSSACHVGFKAQCVCV